MTGRVVVVIPAYQPEDALVTVVTTLAALDREQMIEEILVVDDGSGPAFAPLFARAAATERTRLLSCEKNGGKGAALKRAFGDVLTRAPQVAGVVTADADGQHDPVDILRVAQALLAQPGRLILGVRQFAPDVPLRNRMGNIITRRLLRWRTGVALQDTQTGLRGVPLGWCRELTEIAGERYEWELLTLLAMIRRPIVEIPIRTIYAGGRSHFRPLRDSARIYGAAARRRMR